MLVSDLAQVTFRLPQAAAEAVANFLTELSGGGVEQRDAETIAAPGDGLVEFIVWMPSSDVDGHVHAVEKLLASLKEMNVEVAPFTWESADADPDVWVDAYKRHFRTTRIGRRFVVKPSWENHASEPGDLLIELDPGMAFGTGLHATTKLMMHILERVARLSPAPQSVVDVGCGTGILAIATARLWQASKIIAIDNDPTAVAVCRENVARNGLSDRIEIREGSATRLEGRHSLILANLSYDVLSTEAVRQSFMDHLDDFGRLALAGLLAEQARAIAIQYTRELALEPEYSQEMSGWRALLLRVRA
ncbi:MAG: 50S ribosomal protein L11 methyltransferase [Deltaproteobacteria bacterium]|nr:50S ribosomal protein L11 methyltransferase [Deltaproteobacteria bacterium]